MLGRTFHSIGIISSAVLAWYRVGDYGDAALKTVPIKAGSGIGNCSAEMTPAGSDPLEIVTPHFAAIDRQDLTAAHFHAWQLDVDAVDGFAGDFQGTSRFFCSVPIRVHSEGGLRDRSGFDGASEQQWGVPGRTWWCAPSGGGYNAVGRTDLFDRNALQAWRPPTAGVAGFGAGKLNNSARPLRTRRRWSACAGKGCSIPLMIRSRRPNSGSPPLNGSVAPLPITSSVHSGAISRLSRLTEVYIAAGLCSVALQLLTHHHGIEVTHPGRVRGLGDTDRHGIVRRDDNRH